MKLLLRKQGKTYGEILLLPHGQALARRLNPKSSSILYAHPIHAADALLRHHLKDEEPLR